MQFHEIWFYKLLNLNSNTAAITDVLSVLHLNHCKPLRAGFNRANLVYEVTQKAGNPQAVADQIADMIKGNVPIVCRIDIVEYWTVPGYTVLINRA